MLQKLTSHLRWSKNSKSTADNEQESHESSYVNTMKANDTYDNEGGEGILIRCCPCLAALAKRQTSEDDEEILTSQWALNANEELSPRSSAWLYLAVVSLTGLGTLLMVGDSNVERSYNDVLILGIFSTCFSMSATFCIAYRHRSLRNAVTCDLRWIYYSFEFVISVILLCLWCVIMSIVLDSPIKVVVATTVAETDSTQISWSINLWACAWLGFGVLSYLVGALMLASPMRKRGSWLIDSKTIRHRYEFEESRWAFWFVSLAFQLALTVFSLKLRIGDTCAGSLGTTTFCKRSSLGAAAGLVNALIALSALLLRWLEQMGQFDHWEVDLEMHIWSVETCFSLLSLLMACLNLAYGSSAGGPAAAMGDMFLTSVVGFILSLMLCEQAINSCMMRLYIRKDNASEFEQSVPSEERFDLEKGRRRSFTPRVSRPDDESSFGSSSSSSSSSSSEVSHSHDSIYPPHFGLDGDSSAYSLPKPAPLNDASESSKSNYDSSRHDASRVDSDVSASRETVHVPSSNDESDLNSDSGVDLCFQPDNDVSSIDCSIPSRMPSRVSKASSIDPDGYKIEDDYDAREIKLETTQNMFATPNRKAKSSRGISNRNSALSPVAEQRAVKKRKSINER